MDDLMAFLRAQLDKREQLARAATPGAWRNDERFGYVDTNDLDTHSPVAYDVGESDGEHIAANGPTFVLADVDAKRRIIEYAEEATGYDMQVDNDRRIGPRDEVAEPYVGDSILRLLALPYASHPDYRPEWRL